MARQRWWILVLAAGLAAAGARAEAGESPIPGGRRSAVVQVVEKAKAAVANIQSERVTYSNGPTGQSSVLSRANGMGTGIIVDPRGYIVTNHHVVDEVSMLKVRLADGTTHLATVICKDKDKDLAVIKINPTRSLPTIPFGTSSDLMTGETVIAIGNAFGYEHSVSVGIVSHLHRDVTLNREMSYKALIQTDASINPGNSGGPLLNIDGELVGVNVAIRAGAQGISFALPIDQVLQGVSEMMAKRRAPELQLGFTYRDQIDPKRQPLHALRVDEVKADSAAAKAGLKPGDQITQAGGFAVTCGLDLERALCERRASEKVNLTALRDGKELELAWLPQGAAENVVAQERAWRQLGLRLALGTGSQPGLSVSEVRPGSPAAKAGIQVSDTLAGLHVWETTQFDHVGFVLGHAELKSFAPLKFHLYRAGQLHRGHFASIED